MAEKTDKKITIRSIIGFIGYLLLSPIILFANAGTLNWPIAWIYFGLSIVFAAGTRILVFRKNPDLLEERARYRDSGNVKSWDTLIIPVAAIIGPVAIFVIAGQDRRLNWTSFFPPWAQYTSLGIAFLGMIVSSWAMLENRFFSAVVRIQTDRGHTVCDSGPYKAVRHPGYAGGILFYLMTPVILDSLWAFIPMIVAVAFTVFRTVMEDKTLKAELEGYEEYAMKTRYRLVPGIW